MKNPVLEPPKDMGGFIFWGVEILVMPLKKAFPFEMSTPPIGHSWFWPITIRTK